MSSSENNDIEIKKCLNCLEPVSRRPFLYDSPNFCSGLCKDSFVRKNNNSGSSK